jgi:perosamine synthetase
MAIIRQPSTAIPITFADLILGIMPYRKNSLKLFAEGLSKRLGKKHIFLTNKGTIAFEVILKSLINTSDRKEIILPAYTIPNIFQISKQNGLTVRLVDIDFETLNLNFSILPQVINNNTLSVVPVHLFGFLEPLAKLKEIIKDSSVSIIEDTCQCWGSNPASNDEALASFWSLCRGKNFSTYSGGVLGTNSDAFANELEKEFNKLPEASAKFNLKCLCTMPLYAAAMHPLAYGLLYPLISRFKSTKIHADFPAFQYPPALASFGLQLLKKLPEIEKKRRDTGLTLYKAAINKKEIIVPKIFDGITCGFNHLPIIFRDPVQRESIERKLWKKGIDTGRMYLKPLHMLFDTGYPRDQKLFPNAFLIAEGLLTIPTHPYLRQKDINNILNILEGIK